MIKTSGWILTLGLVLVVGAGVRAQMFGSPGQVFGGPAGQVPPEMAEMQKAQERLASEAAPEFYAFQQKLRHVEGKIGKITASLAKGEIDKDAAREALLPLVKEEQNIRSDPDFLVEQKLAQALFSSAEFQEKMQKLMEKMSLRRKPAGKTGAGGTPNAPR